MQDEEIKEKTAQIEHADKCLTTLKLELKVRFSASLNCLSQHYYEGLPILRFLLTYNLITYILHLAYFFLLWSCVRATAVHCACIWA